MGEGARASTQLFLHHNTGGVVRGPNKKLLVANQSAFDFSDN